MAKKTTNPINNHHDLFFKATISSPQAIQDFFSAHLPKKLLAPIDLLSIQPAKASHVSASLKESHNDLVFTCQIDKNQGFLIIEHQSSPDWHMPIRLIRYNTELLEHYMKGKKPGTTLPYIYNICMAHSKLHKPYPYSNNFYDYFPNPHLAIDLAPLVKFDLFDITSCSDDQLESHGTVGLMEKLFKYQGEKSFFDVLGKELERCKDWIRGTASYPAPLGVYYWKSILYYASNVLDPLYTSEAELVSLFKEKLFITKDEIMRTIARQIEKRGEVKGIQKGMQKGMQQGMQKNKLEIAKSMLKEGCEIKLIEKVTNLSRQTIEELSQG